MRKFLNGFVIGGLLSSVTALLTAKKTGKDTQNAIKENIDTIKTAGLSIPQTQKAITQLKNTVPQTTEQLKDVSTTIKTFQNDLKPVINRMNRRIDIIKQHLQQKGK